MKPFIESRSLHVFVALARTLNMSHTAKNLGMTPSAISHSLRILEKELGCRLFERTSRKMALTPSGREMFNDAVGILEDMQVMRNRVTATKKAEENCIRVGASTTTCQFILPPVLREFRESFPDCSLKIEACGSAAAAIYLKENRIDLAIAVEPPHAPSLEYKLLGEDDLQFVVHPLHASAIKRRVSRETVVERQLILPDSTSETYALIKAYFARENLHVQPFIEVANEEAIKSFLTLDMGVGILPRWMVAAEVHRGALTTLPLGKRVLKRRWMLMCLRRHKFNFQESLFASICKSVLRELVRV